MNKIDLIEKSVAFGYILWKAIIWIPLSYYIITWWLYAF